jgi:hypothetical protein
VVAPSDQPDADGVSAAMSFDEAGGLCTRAADCERWSRHLTLRNQPIRRLSRHGRSRSGQGARRCRGTWAHSENSHNLLSAVNLSPSDRDAANLIELPAANRNPAGGLEAGGLREPALGLTGVRLWHPAREALRLVDGVCSRRDVGGAAQSADCFGPAARELHDAVMADLLLQHTNPNQYTVIADGHFVGQLAQFSALLGNDGPWTWLIDAAFHKHCETVSGLAATRGHGRITPGGARRLSLVGPHVASSLGRVAEGLVAEQQPGPFR